MGNESAYEATNQMSTPQMKNESANETTKMIANAPNNATKGMMPLNQHAANVREMPPTK